MSNKGVNFVPLLSYWTFIILCSSVSLLPAVLLTAIFAYIKHSH